MKKIAILIGGLIVLLGAWMMVSSEEKPQEDGLRVAATIFPIYDIAQTIAGDTADVMLLAEPGVSPHYYEPTAKQMRELRSAAVIYTIGQELDPWAERIGESLAVAHLDLSSAVDLMKFEEDDHGHEDHADEHGHDDHRDEHADEDHHEEEAGHDDDEHAHAHGEFDPHYWLSPDNAVHIAETVAEDLSLRNPEDASVYAANLAGFIAEIEAAEKNWKRTISGISHKELVTFHDAFGYFADHFGLDIVATFEPFPGKEPTPQYLANLQHEVEEKNIKALFIEPQLSANAIATFAADNKLELGVLDPLGGLKETGTYIDLITFNVNAVAKALK